MTNQLAQETSPYLQEHADNHVNWCAWNDETLRIARTLDKSILLSIDLAMSGHAMLAAHYDA